MKQDSNKLIDHLLNLTTSDDDENTEPTTEPINQAKPAQMAQTLAVNVVSKGLVDGSRPDRDSMKYRIKKPFPTPEKPLERQTSGNNNG